MEPIAVAPSNDDPAPLSSNGELIVQNGRQAGARRPIQTPMTLIGRGQGCDIRLNVEGIHPLHCALLPSPAGIVLRDLGSETGTLVNERRVASCLLRDGDVLTIGPFQLQIRWTPQEQEMPRPVPAGFGEVDALRVQAAAVAAQQTALLEEENRLQQRRLALERQEQQLGAHLEEKRQQLVELREVVKGEREALKQQHEGLAQERTELLAAAEKERKEAAETLTKARRERDRLSSLRRRLYRRWKKQFSVHEQKLKQTERQVEARARSLTSEQERLEAEKTQLKEARLRLNGERELTRREQREQWQDLQNAQDDWRARKQKQESVLAKKQQKLEERLQAVHKAEQAVLARQKDTAALRDDLAREAEGLETRITNLRRLLTESQPLPTLEPATAPQAPMNLMAEEHRTRWLARLEAVAADLADQRMALVEQWQHFLESQKRWHDEQAAVLPQMEETARGLDDREQHIQEQERQLAAQGEALHERQQALARLRGELEGWRVRLTVSETAWKKERATLLLRTQRETDAAKKQQVRLSELRRQWAVRRKEEVTHLMRELQRFKELQRLYGSLREEYEQRVASLAGEHRLLAERTLALDQLELERIGKSEDAVAAEKRLLKFRRQIGAMHEEAECRLAERGKHLEEEAHRLAVQAQHIQQRLQVLGETEDTLSSRQTEWEHRLLEAEQMQDQLQQQVQDLKEQEEMTERRCQELQAEIERVVAVLLENGETAPQREQAA